MQASLNSAGGVVLETGEKEGALPVEGPVTLSVAGNELTVFVESPALFEAMLRDIAAARRRVWIETYIFYNDEGGKRFAEALKEKARAGADVRVLYDALGSASAPGAFFAEMQAAGVKVHAYHSFLEGLRQMKPLAILNRRNHRKITVVDDAAGYFGGMNIIDNVEHVGKLKLEHRPASSGWRDVHVRLAGPQQGELAASFERSWRRALGEKVEKKPRALRRALLRQAADGAGESAGPEACVGTEAGELIRFFDSEPRNKFSRASRVYATLMRAARRQITLSMAYFLPVGATLRALLAARRRRVRVRVIVPGKSDVRIVQHATAYLYDRMIRRGFRVYERRHRMLHSKVMVVDDLYTVVGSANLDPRSLTMNLEFLAVIRSQGLARVMARICRFEISQSEQITMKMCRRTSRWGRFVNGLAWGLRWWL